MDPTPATFTLVYECDDGHEQTEHCESLEEVDNYAVEDADMCPHCEGYGVINYPVLDRIEVNH